MRETAILVEQQPPKGVFICNYAGLVISKFSKITDLKDKGSNDQVRTTLERVAVSLLHWRAGSWRSFAAMRKEAGLFCGSFLRKGEVFNCVGKNQNFKDLMNLAQESFVGMGVAKRRIPHDKSRSFQKWRQWW